MRAPSALALAWGLALAAAYRQPNIVLLLVDDAGHADLPTPLTEGVVPRDYSLPALGRIMANGTLVRRSYVQALCSPTRTALLTGRYAASMGMDHGVITAGAPYGLPVSHKTLADVLKGAGYTSRAYGKWDAGFACQAMVPTRRGFDSFFGYFNAAEDYFTHMRGGVRARFPNGNVRTLAGYDWQRLGPNGTGGADRAAQGKYSTQIIGEEAAADVRAHAATFPDEATRPPLFLYLATQALHSPLEVPDRFINETECARLPTVTGRRTFCGMAKALDQLVANVLSALESAGMAENTIWAALGDNGGHTKVGGRNTPLRGEKSSLFEGGFRSGGLLLASPRTDLLPPGPRRYDGLFHVSDILPTLSSVAGIAGAPPVPQPLDGVDQWEAIAGRAVPPRQSALLHLDRRPAPAPSAALIRADGAKLVTGIPTWYKAPSGWAGCATAGECPTGYTALNGSVVPPPPHNASLIWTFNVTADPEEREDLTATRWDLTQSLLSELQVFNATLPQQVETKADYRSDPASKGGNWEPWIPDAECPV